MGKEFGFCAQSHGFCGKAFLKGLGLFDSSTLYDTPRVLNRRVCTSDAKMPTREGQFPSQVERLRIVQRYVQQSVQHKNCQQP